MRIDDLNEAPMGVLNRMAQKVVSKVPGNIGATAQGKLDTGRVANQWKKDYMTYLGRTGQKADTENLKAFLKTLGLNDQDTASIVGESALIERALTSGELDKIMLKAAQKGAAGGLGASNVSDAGSQSAEPEQTPQQTTPKSPTLAQKAGQAVKGLASKAAAVIKGKMSPNKISGQSKVEPSVSTTTAATPVKGTGSGIDTYINNWAKSINAAASPQEKINLAKEVISFLRDRKGSSEGQRGAAMAKAVLKRSKDPTLQKMAQSGAFALERKIYAAANKLLESVGLTWKDLGYRIAVTESTADYVVIIER